MIEPTELLVLLLMHTAASAMLAFSVGQLLHDVRRGRPEVRHALALFAFWAGALSPIGALLPSALVVTWGQDAQPILSLQMWVLPRLSAWNGLAALLLTAAFTVSAFRLVGVVIAVLRAERLLREAKPISGAACRLRLATHHLIAGPMVVGLFRPTVLLPPNLLGSPDLPGILRHEAVHIAQGHLRGALAQAIAEALMWWNPGLRSLGNLLNEQRELVCDASAAGSAQKGFAASLVRAARASALRRSSAFGIGAAEGDLARRIDRLLQRPKPLKVWAAVAILTAIMITVLAAPRRDSQSETRLAISSTSPFEN